MRFVMLSLTALALVGCADHPVDQFEAVGESINDELCSCPAFETEDFCTMPDEPTSAERSCFKRVYDEYEGEVAETFDCLIDASKEFDRCVRAADCDLGALSSCNGVYEARLDGCPDVTEAADNAFDACDAE